MSRPDADPESVPIRDEMIRLGQFLQLAQVAEDSTSAKLLLADEVVSVNDEPESRRGRQLNPGDVVAVDLPAGARRFRVGG